MYREPRLKRRLSLTFTLREHAVFVGICALVIVRPIFFIPAITIVLFYLFRNYHLSLREVVVLMFGCSLIGGLLGLALGVARW
jgi:hypothetical protein